MIEVAQSKTHAPDLFDDAPLALDVSSDLGSQPMVDSLAAVSPSLSAQRGAGFLIREARTKSGLELAALASILKIPVKKLQAIEHEHWSELGDTVFARALTQSICRHLQLNSDQILSLLPSQTKAVVSVPDTLATVVDAPLVVRFWHSMQWNAWLKRFWLPAALLLGAFGFYWMPSFKASSTPISKGAALPPPVNSSPELDPNVAGVAAMAPKNQNLQAQAQSESSLEKPAAALADQSTVASSGAAAQPFLLQLVAARNSWVEIYDVSGALRFRRMLSSGETVSFEKTKGWSVVVGNADATDVFVGGQKYDVLTISKNNVTRFTVK